MEATISRKGIFVSQRKNILDFLKEIEELGIKFTATSMVQKKKHKTTKDDQLVEKGRNKCFVGKLVYFSFVFYWTRHYLQ